MNIRRNKMQVGIRLHDTTPAPLPERLKATRELGFTCAHVALSKVIDEMQITDGTLTPGFAMYLKKLFAQNDMDPAVLGCYLNLADPNPVQLRKTQSTYKAQIRFASWLGAGVVGTETGTPNETYAETPKSRSEEALATFIRNLAPVVEYAEHMGVILAIEPVIRHIVHSPARARLVLDAIQSPNLQIILDPVNLLDMTNAAKHREVIKEAIDVLGEDVAVIHIKDFAVQNGDVISMAAGQGVMDYTDLIRFIKKDKPFIHATLEDTIPSNSVQALQFMERLYAEC